MFSLVLKKTMFLLCMLNVAGWETAVLRPAAWIWRSVEMGFGLFRMVYGLWFLRLAWRVMGLPLDEASEPGLNMRCRTARGWTKRGICFRTCEVRQLAMG